MHSARRPASAMATTSSGDQERRVELRRRLGERAVVAVVPAQHRERDEHLARIGDGPAVAQVPEAGGDRHQLLERLAPRREERLRLGDRERLARAGARQRAPELMGGLDHRSNLRRYGATGKHELLAPDAPVSPATARERIGPDEGRGAGGRDRGGEVPPRADPRGPGRRPDRRRQHGRGRMVPRPVRLAGPRLGDLLAGRRHGSRTRLGPGGRDIPRHRGAAGVERAGRVVRPGRPRPGHASGSDADAP